MRLWHQKLIPYLDNKRLLGQHRECCALRGKGWGKKHSTVDYVFKHHYALLFWYHCQVMYEMKERKYHIESLWLNATYRGKTLGFDNHIYDNSPSIITYPEHNDAYLKECLLNLQSKGAKLINGTCISEQLLKLAIEGRA